MSKVKVGDKVSVKTVAYPDKAFFGTIKKIGTMLDPQSRVIRVRTELDNSDGLLKPEMFANSYHHFSNKWRSARRIGKSPGTRE